MTANGVLISWKLCVYSCVVGILCIAIANFSWDILSVGGLTFVLCVLSIFTSSFIFSLFYFNKLLQNNKPLNHGYFTLFPKDVETKPNPVAIKKLSDDINKYYLDKWYQYISIDKDFNVETKLVLEDVLTKVVQIQSKVISPVLIQGILNIYLKHLKEYRRALKRKSKYGGNIEDLYRYSHVCSNSTKNQEYYMQQLSIHLFNHFINDELRNSLPCHILVSIFSKKVMLYFLNLLSNPHFINYQVLKLTSKKEKKNKFHLENYNKVSLTPIKENDDSKTEKTTLIKEDKLVQEPIKIMEDKKTIVKKIDSSQKSIKNMDETHKKDILKSPTSNTSVKIYEPKSSSKTWHNSEDLKRISLGTDSLDCMLNEIENSIELDLKCTGPVAENIHPKSIMDEVKSITSMETFKSSIKPISKATLANIKDFQDTTMHTAIHKIEDLQDEAAGVVEGILDKGIAGFRKGLRLTCLQENIENAKVAISTTASATKKKLQESVESATEVSSNNSSNNSSVESPKFELIEDLDDSSVDSPCPIYEETADLESTIAKLRSLLQQKSSESNMSTPAVSPMPEDYIQKLEISDDTDATDGVMPSFYKFCAKTATGVLHKSISTIKTALPASNSDQILVNEKWFFVQSNHENNEFINRAKKLLNERKDFCKVDMDYTLDYAFEAIDSLDSGPDTLNLLNSKINYEDELDDFEVSIPMTKALLDIICELLADTESKFLQEPIIKAILIIFGNKIENDIIRQANIFIERLNEHLFTIPETSINETLFIELDRFVEAILENIPIDFGLLENGSKSRIIKEHRNDMTVTTLANSMDSKINNLLYTKNKSGKILEIETHFLKPSKKQTLRAS